MNLNLPIYGITGNIELYWTSKIDTKAGTERLPPKSSLLRADSYEPLDTITPNDKDMSVFLDTSCLSEEDKLPEMPSNEEPVNLFTKKYDKDISLSSFVIKKVIGKGSFGKVFLV